jgi:hypothetical protein
MSKRKEPEGAAPADAVAGPPTPPRLGDHSSYMAEPLLPLDYVHIKVAGGRVLPAHAMKLVETCAALARSSELFVSASPARPAALSAPFDEYAEADVARFLLCIYDSAKLAARGEDAARPAVVRLAHALDAAPVLAAARRHMLAELQGSSTLTEVCSAAELASLFGWGDVRTESVSALVDGLQTLLGAATATPAQQALSDIDAFDVAHKVIEKCVPELATHVFGTLAANFRRLHAKASAAARDSALSPAEAAAAALVSANGTALEVDGRFMDLMSVPDLSSDITMIRTASKSHGLDWELILEPNGGDGDDGHPCVGVGLLGDWPKKAR